MAATVPRTVLAILVALFGVLVVAASLFGVAPICTAEGTCSAPDPLSAVPGLAVGALLVAAGVGFDRRY